MTDALATFKKKRVSGGYLHEAVNEAVFRNGDQQKPKRSSLFSANPDCVVRGPGITADWDCVVRSPNPVIPTIYRVGSHMPCRNGSIANSVACQCLCDGGLER